MESEPVGLFAHQVRIRGTHWKRVGPTRFVPEDESSTAPIFVEWRREGAKWVVSGFGDERFSNVPLPAWCC